MEQSTLDDIITTELKGAFVRHILDNRHTEMECSRSRARASNALNRFRIRTSLPCCVKQRTRRHIMSASRAEIWRRIMTQLISA